METKIMPEFPEIIDLISKIKHFELISPDWKKRIEFVYPDLNVFAKVEIEISEGDTEEVFLALQFNEEKTHYTHLVSLKYLTTIFNKDRFVRIELKKFSEPIKIGTNITIRKATSEEEKVFNERHLISIGASGKAHLIGIITIDDERYFIGYYHSTMPVYTSYLIFEAVENKRILNNHSIESGHGGWSSFMYLSPESDLYKKSKALYPTIPGSSFTPLSYKQQIVNGTNYQVLGLFTYAGIGIHHKLEILHFHESIEGEISNVNITSYCK